MPLNLAALGVEHMVRIVSMAVNYFRIVLQVFGLLAVSRTPC